jgi:phosphate transport system permease protein
MTEVSTARPALKVVTPDARARAADVPRRPSEVSVTDTAQLAGAAAAALGLVWVIFERLLPFSGPIAFWLLWYVTFVGLVAVIVGLEHGRQVLKDRIAALFCYSAGAAVLAVLALVIGYTAYRGWHALRPNFFTESMAATGPLDPLSKGGAFHAIVGTLEQVGIAVAISVPLGVSCAVFLNEVKGPLARPVRMIVDAMSAIPSIVAGLFIFATVILTLGVEKSGFAASLALTVMMLPIITRASEVVLRLVPDGLREASYALGSSQARTVWYVILPTARPGLVTAVLLGIARGVGETAPVLLTAGVTAQLNTDPFQGPQLSLPLFVYNLVRLPQPIMVQRAYGGALTLLAIVLVLFVAARVLGGRAPGELSRRQRRRIARST